MGLSHTSDTLKVVSYNTFLSIIVANMSAQKLARRVLLANIDSIYALEYCDYDIGTTWCMTLRTIAVSSYILLPFPPFCPFLLLTPTFPTTPAVIKCQGALKQRETMVIEVVRTSSSLRV
jgi:hypothetical protein